MCFSFLFSINDQNLCVTTLNIFYIQINYHCFPAVPGRGREFTSEHGNNGVIPWTKQNLPDFSQEIKHLPIVKLLKWKVGNKHCKFGSISFTLTTKRGRYTVRKAAATSTFNPMFWVLSSRAKIPWVFLTQVVKTWIKWL